MNPAVTILLPVHNGERTLRAAVIRVLDMAPSLSRPLQLAIVDDGSTDETFEAACELARAYPQVHVFRQPFRRGLGAAVDVVRRRLAVELLIAHDGAGPINVDELGAMLRSLAVPPTSSSAGASAEGRGSRRFSSVTALNVQLAEAHRAATPRHWVRIDSAATGRSKSVGGLPVADGATPFGYHAMPSMPPATSTVP